MGVLQGGDVVEQGLLVAGNVQDTVEATGQFERDGIQPTAWRIDEQRGMAEGFEVDLFQAREFFAAGQGVALAPDVLGSIAALLADFAARGIILGSATARAS